MLGQSGEQRQAVLPPVEGMAEEADLWWSRSWLSAFALHVTYLPGATCCCHTSSRVGMVSHPWTLLPACAQPLAQHCGLGKASVHSGRTWSNWTRRDASRTFTRHEVNTSRRSPLRLWQCGTAAVASSKVGQRNWKESKMKTQLLMQVDCVAITNSRKDNRLQREGNEITLFVYRGV